jgi:UDP-N-acetylmuramate dehydrogenase
MSMRLVSPFAGLESMVEENAPLAPLTWYKIGGPARWLIRPTSVEALSEIVLRCHENDIRLYVLGLGANLLVSDEGVDGAVIRLDHEAFCTVSYQENIADVGAGADLMKLVLRTVRQGLAGIENLAGIPGTLGGAVRMNAGGKFGDIGSAIVRVQVMDGNGGVFERTKDDLVFSYRSTNISAPVILGATLELEVEDPQLIIRRTKEIWMYKRNTQPLNTKNAGCIFKNPGERSAGALIDQAGLKGLSIGGAEVSTKHANFIVAHPGCRAEDVLRLIKIIKEKVYDRDKIELQTEVKMWPVSGQ